MRSLIFLTLMVLSVALLGYMKQQPGLEPAAHNVLGATLYGYGGGLAINTALAIAAPHLDPEIKPNDAMMSCSPYGITAGALIMRAYVFNAGGWGRAEWAYVRSLPKEVVEFGMGKLGVRRSGNVLTAGEARGSQGREL